MTSRPIRIILVEDSPVCLTILKRMLSMSEEVEIVGTAKNGREALDLIPQVDPQVICTDLEMPVMDGLELTKEIMAHDPRAILVVSNYVQKEDTHNIFRLLEAGAIDVFPKPRGGSESDYQAQKQELIAKIKILAGVVVFRRRGVLPSSAPSEKLGSVPSVFQKRGQFDMVVIGASTGGPQALHVILSQLQKDFPAPVICVQHISEGFLDGLVGWLASQCSMQVMIAQSGETPKPGIVYFPEEGKHLELNSEGRFISSCSEPVDGHRPSVDVTFQAVAQRFGRSAVGVLLTGMGQDGAAGMRTLSRAGGLTIAQDQQSCIVFGMPKHAIELGAASQVLPLNDIASTLISTVCQ